MDTIVCYYAGEFAIGYVRVRFEVKGEGAWVSSDVRYEDEADEGKLVDGFRPGADGRSMSRAQAHKYAAELLARGYKRCR